MPSKPTTWRLVDTARPVAVARPYHSCPLCNRELSGDGAVPLGCGWMQPPYVVVTFTWESIRPRYESDGRRTGEEGGCQHHHTHSRPSAGQTHCQPPIESAGVDGDCTLRFVFVNTTEPDMGCPATTSRWRVMWTLMGGDGRLLAPTTGAGTPQGESQQAQRHQPAQTAHRPIMTQETCDR